MTIFPDTAKQEIYSIISTIDINISHNLIGKQRAVADEIEESIRQALIDNFTLGDVVLPKSNKSVDDFSIAIGGDIFLFDVKTRETENAKFSMPNLISINVLNKTLKKENHQIMYIFIEYKVEKQKVKITHFEIRRIQEIDLDCIGIGNLGTGQLQIKEGKKQLLNSSLSDDEWYTAFKIKAHDFYIKLAELSMKRAKEFE